MIKRWLIPNQTDGMILLAGLVLVLGWQIWHVHTTLPDRFAEPYFVASFVMNGFVLLAIACCLGWNNFHSKKTWGLLGCCIIALFGPAVVDLIIGSNEESMMQKMYRSPYSSNFNSEDSFAKLQSLYSLLVLGIAIAFFILIAGGRFFVKWIFRYLQKISVKVSRTKGLIYVACVLFVLAMANNILIANGINVFRESPGNRWVERLFELIVSFVVFPVVIVGLSWCLVRSCRVWLVLLASLLVVFAPVLVSGEIQFLNRAPREILLAIGGVFGVFFLLTIFSIRKTWSASETTSDRDIKPRGSLRRPSLWGGFVFCAVALFALAPSLFDYAVLATPYGFGFRKATFEERLKFAWESARINRQTNGAIKRMDQSYIVECAKVTKPDILNLVDASKPPVIFINNITTAIETSHIREQTKQMSLLDGKVTTKQLSDFLQNAIGLFQISNVGIEGERLPDPVDSSAVLYVSHEKPGEVGKLLAGFPSFSSPRTVTITSKIYKEDWPLIRDLNQKNLSVSIVELDDVNHDFDFEEGQSLDHIILQIGNRYSSSGQYLTTTSATELKLILGSNVNLQWTHGAFTNQECLELLFATPDRFVNGLTLNHFRHLRNSGVENDEHFAYGFNDAGELTDLFLPYGENAENFSRFKELRTLSFDPKWILKFPPMSTERVSDLTSLLRLTKLQELYFSDCAITNSNLSFLKPLKQLKHLQIPSIARDGMGAAGFDVCQSLESVVLLGKPDKQTIKEFQKLKNLTRLVIVDSLNDNLLSGNFESDLVTALPDVSITIVPFGQFKPEVPAKFQKHVEAIKANLTKRIERELEK